MEVAESCAVQDLNGRALACATHHTTSLTLLVSGNHQEQIQFFLIPSSLSPAVLGSPRLANHNSQIDWTLGTITMWSSCCLRSALPPVPLDLTSPSAAVDPTVLPQVYHALGEVFSKQWAFSLPPHHLYDCAINLLPGAPLTSSRLYHLSRLEHETMESYISESLV